MKKREIFQRILAGSGLLALLALAACTSYAEIKNLDVDRRYEYPSVSAEVFSACVQDMLLEQLAGMFIRRTYDGRHDQWFVVHELGAGWVGKSRTGTYTYSLSFEDEPEGVIIVELRSRKTIWGGLQAPEEEIEQSLRECASNR